MTYGLPVWTNIDDESIFQPPRWTKENSVGLDLVVKACALPGHEIEWRTLVARAFRNENLPQKAIDRFSAISIPAHERVGAPRVGYDPAANAWMIEVRKATTPDEVARVLKEFHGYYVLRLAKSDGLPEYSHGGHYEGVDETSFRGKILEYCGDVLPVDLLGQAWDHKFPEDAINYGRALLAAADAAEIAQPVVQQAAPAPAKKGLFAWFWQTETVADNLPLDEQLQAVRSAGRWFLFWGERGHAIRAWY